MTQTNFLNNFDAIFFDLDGTLVGLSDEALEVNYIKLVTKRFLPYLTADQFTKALWLGTENMMKHNSSSIPVLETFFETFTEQTGMNRKETFDHFDDFYRNEFNQLKDLCEPVPEAKLIVQSLKKQGKKIVLATLPIFPEIATRARCAWSDLDYDDFDYVSHAQNSMICKPLPEYFLSLCRIVSVDPKRVLMVGNDYIFDMAASAVGMTTWMIDKFQGNVEFKGKYKVDVEAPLSDLLNRIESQ